jgi:hypothetical protein
MIPLDSLNSPDKSPFKPQKKSFSSFLEASFCYYSQDFWDFSSLCYDDVESLRLQEEELEKIKTGLEKNNKDLVIECEMFESSLKSQTSSRKEFEVSLNALNSYVEGLEKALAKANNEIRFIRSQTEQEETAKACNSKRKNVKELEKPTPKPINYKPLTRRSLRNSREVSFNNLKN